MKKSQLILTLMLLACLAVYISGCYYDKESLLYPGSASIDCTTVNAKYNADVKPIMQNKCNTAGCHNTAGNAGGVILETHAQVAAKAARITQRCVIDKNMPPGSPLTPAEIATLKCWIDSGTPNN